VREEIWAATKAVILHHKRVLLIQRSNYCGAGENDWEIPGGGLQFGEDLLEGLNREIMEEVSLSVRVDKLLYAMTALVSPTRQIVGLTYLADADSDAVTLSHEHKDYVWATREQIVALLNKPMLNDFMKHSVLDMLDID
jgi:8-oxo-dGTP diphosphatase